MRCAALLTAVPLLAVGCGSASTLSTRSPEPSFAAEVLELTGVGADPTPLQRLLLGALDA